MVEAKTCLLRIKIKAYTAFALLGLTQFLYACASTPPWLSLQRLRPAHGNELPTDVNLTGIWIRTAEGGTSGPVQRFIPCDGYGEYWAIEQRGTSIQAEFHRPANHFGIAGKFEIGAYEFVLGSRRQNFLHLEDYYRDAFVYTVKSPGPKTKRPEKEELVYELRFDEPTQHLIGTRNGMPIRLAPLLVKPQESPCGLRRDVQ